MTPPSPPPAGRTWARTERATPSRRESPRSLDELVRAVRDSGGERVRAVGGGHSLTGAAGSDGVLIELDALDVVERVDPRPDGTTHVTVGAGIRLAQLDRFLPPCGDALRNLGDIDRQSIAGAISTGTHGTGARLGGLATQVVGARIVSAKGDVVEISCEENPELFELARLGLGSAGVLCAVTLEVVPAFKLEAVEEPWHLD